jgi:hypothetical protein
MSNQLTLPLILFRNVMEDQNVPSMLSSYEQCFTNEICGLSHVVEGTNWAQLVGGPASNESDLPQESPRDVERHDDSWIPVVIDEHQRRRTATVMTPPALRPFTGSEYVIRAASEFVPLLGGWPRQSAHEHSLVVGV